MTLGLVFAYNPTGWDPDGDEPIAGGMTDVHIQPVLAHLDEYQLAGAPAAGDVVNVYYTHRRTYGIRGEPGRVSVFAGHGIADKAWRNASRMVTHFDWAVTSGPAWTHRLAAGGFPADRILEVGYPKLDPIYAGEVASPWPNRDGRIRVLWAPTHGGGGEAYRFSTNPPSTSGARRTSWWARRRILDALPASEFDVLEAPHPRHRPDGLSTLAEFVGADVVIADGGSTIYEAWALDLPVVFPSWLTAAGHLDRARTNPTHESDIYLHQVGRHATSPSELGQLVTDAAATGITELETKFVGPILPLEYRGTAGKRLAAALRIIADIEPPPSTTAFVNFRHYSGRVVEIPSASPRLNRYLRSKSWELVDAP